MKRYCLSLAVGLAAVLVMLATSCQSSHGEAPSHNEALSRSEAPSNGAAPVDTIHLRINWKRWMDNSYLGALEDLPKEEADSAGSLYFREEVKGPVTCEVIFSCKDTSMNRKMDSMVGNGALNDFVDFNGYAFLLPLKDAKGKDLYTFPCLVKAYKKLKGDNWAYVTEVRVEDFSQFNKFRFKVICKVI